MKGKEIQRGKKREKAIDPKIISEEGERKVKEGQAKRNINIYSQTSSKLVFPIFIVKCLSVAYAYNSISLLAARENTQC